MKEGPHPYQEISLGTAGLVLGIILVAVYGFIFLKADTSKKIAQKLPRNADLGTYFMGFGMVWFWLLVAPPDKGVFSTLSMDLGEFNKVKTYLMIGVPLFCIGMIIYVREFLFVRGLGLCLLMASAPLLYASDFVSSMLYPPYSFIASPPLNNISNGTLLSLKTVNLSFAPIGLAIGVNLWKPSRLPVYPSDLNKKGLDSS